MKQVDRRIPLRQGIKEIFDDERLDDERLRLLKAAASGAPERPQRRRWLAAAASIAAGAGLATWFGRGVGVADNLERLADEVAYNHLAGQPLDVTGSTIEALRPAFASLGFSLLDAPPESALEGAELVGGRFCSVSSIPAVQLRYLTPRGTASVIQSRFDPERHRDAPDMAIAAQPAVRQARGVAVSLCHARGVFVAVATTG